jgi:hypothetical protein
MDSARFARVIARLDELNAADPHTVTEQGHAVPRELWYARRLTAWVLRLNPAASEWLQIAARGQHVRRWTLPRDRYPRTRAGYLKWRETLKAFHGDEVVRVMTEAGYAPGNIERVRRIILKKDVAGDPDAQTIEDALCLVFLETQLADLRARTSDEKMRDVVAKTWRKMSPQARDVALTLPLAPDQWSWLRSALEAAGPEG